MQLNKDSNDTKLFEDLISSTSKKLPKMQHKNPEQATDLFLWCVDDISKKLRDLGAVIPDNFRESLYKNLLVETFEMVAVQLEKFYPQQAKMLKKQITWENLLEYISREIEVNIEFGMIFNKALIASYITACMKYEVPADSFVSSFLYN